METGPGREMSLLLRHVAAVQTQYGVECSGYSLPHVCKIHARDLKSGSHLISRLPCGVLQVRSELQRSSHVASVLAQVCTPVLRVRCTRLRSGSATSFTPEGVCVGSNC